MYTYIVSYDLGGPETSASYKLLGEKIQSLGNNTKPLESFWVVKTNFTQDQIVTILSPFLDSNDKILVANLDTGHFAWKGNLNDNASQWLLSNIKGN